MMEVERIEIHPVTPMEYNLREALRRAEQRINSLNGRIHRLETKIRKLEKDAASQSQRSPLECSWPSDERSAQR